MLYLFGGEPTRIASFKHPHTKAGIAGFEETKVSTMVKNCCIDCKKVSNGVATQRVRRFAFSLSR